MKQSRQLFTALPLLPFPMAFEDVVRSIPGSEASESATHTPDFVEQTASSTASKSVVLKLAAASVVVAVAGILGLYFSGASSTIDSTQHAQQQIEQSPQAETKLAENKDTGIVKLNGLVGSGQPKSDLAANIVWEIYPTGANMGKNGSKATQTKKGASVKFGLTPGRYKAVARLGDLKQSTDIEVKLQDTESKSLTFNAGLVDIKLVPAKATDIDLNRINWELSEQASKRRLTAMGNKAHYLPPGQYRISATHAENLKKTMDLKVSAGKRSVIDSWKFDFSKVSLKATLSKQEPLKTDMAKQLDWEIWQKQDKQYQLLAQRSSLEPDLLLAPGSYKVKVQFGDTLTKTRNFHVDQDTENQSISIDFNAASLTLLAKIKSKLPELSAALSWSIYDLGANKPKLVFRDNNPEAVSYLGAGKYRIVAEAGLNNRQSRTITLQAGQQAKINDIELNPGAIQLAAKSELKNTIITEDIRWQLEQHVDGESYKSIKTPKSARPLLVLAPGHYRVTAQYADRFKQTHEFTITAGQIAKQEISINDDPRPKAWR